jgi:O-succinylbenzoic acid--CoA ligase
LTNFAFRELAPAYEASYKVMEGVCIRVDEESVLHVRYPGVTDGEVCTGDLVELTGDNAFVWKGRKDFLINSGGLKVCPEYVESLLSEVLPDRAFVVSSVVDEVFGERIVVVIEGDGSEDAAKWMRQIDALYAEKAISRAIKPLEIRFMEKLPVTQTGKPDRRKVRTILNRS